jgi:mannan endo-1,4-beta-mannosidase
MKTNQSLLGSAFALARLLTLGLAAPSTEPVNPDASESARNLLSYLVGVSADGSTLSGQQDLADVDWVTQNVGKTPAILGVDLMDYSPSRVEFGASATTVEDAITFAGQGGIIAFCWHWGKLRPHP